MLLPIEILYPLQTKAYFPSNIPSSLVLSLKDVSVGIIGSLAVVVGPKLPLLVLVFVLQ